ncbi:MAG: hypothetical protein K6C94_03540 [Candidatus Gastranaerophilales bacterium]|nr:hypothetical protein [Candidatus Gastranaerophilales bacterium]
MKKLSLAFVWHFHQPDYHLIDDNVMLMPWTRLNAVQTYAGMLDYFEQFPELKLNFDMSPVLTDSLLGYAEGTLTDIYSNLTMTQVENLSQDDMEFILNYFFSLDYNKFISKYPRYVDLYKRRFAKEEIDTDEFSMSGYSDIMTLFNLVWFTAKQVQNIPEVKEVAEKGKHYTSRHREILLEKQNEIIKKIIPTFRKYAQEGKIELLTCPYYHPILPLLADMDSAKEFSLRNPLPGSDIKMPECTRAQIENGLRRTEEVFGVRPKGIWAPEQCISSQVMQMMSEAGLEWTISDETVLTDTLNKEFVRDFNGFHQDPYDLCNTYSVRYGEKDFKIIFRDSVLPNLISFEYANYDAKTAARDLYDRIKVVYNKLQNAPYESHLLTIAMDGENAWHNYRDGGSEFLTELYGLICADKTLETVKISDYFENLDHVCKLEHIKTGSGIKKDFRFWTAEPVKNMAWRYLFNVYEDLKNFEQDESTPREQIAESYKHLYTAQGSDWFWWYGEPNDSGQDHLFDYLFREHLKHIYVVCGKPVPEHLEEPLATFTGKPSRIPKGLISPNLTGNGDYENEWQNAGCIDVPASPLIQENKLFNKICFGSDFDNLYFLFDVNKYIYSLKNSNEQIYQVYIYIKTNKDEFQETAPVRPLNKTENICNLLKSGYTHEIKLTFMKDKNFPLFFSKAIKNNLWVMNKNHSVESVYGDVIEMKIPFDDLEVKAGEKIDFFIINGTFGRVEDIYPQDLWLTIKRPERINYEEM